MKKASKKTGLRINQISPGANVVLTAFMILLAVIFVFPVVLVVSISFSSQESIDTFGYRFIPNEWSTYAYEYLWKMGEGIWRSYANTIFYSVVGTVASLIIMSMFAYVLARREFKVRNLFAFYAFFTTLFGAGLVPNYILITQWLEINNTIWVFFLPGLVAAFNVIILRTFIQSTIHESLLESAKLDGASEFQIYLKIVMPLFKAGLASVGLFTFVNKWNDWFTGLTYVQDKKLQPIMTVLQRMQRQLDMLKQMTPENAMANAEMLRNIPGASARMAITFIAMLPLLVCYPFFQKYFIRGLTIGSVKG